MWNSEYVWFSFPHSSKDYIQHWHFIHSLHFFQGKHKGISSVFSSFHRQYCHALSLLTEQWMSQFELNSNCSAEFFCKEKQTASAMTFKRVFHRHNTWTMQLLITWTEIYCIKISPWLSSKYRIMPNRWISLKCWGWSFKKLTLKREQDVIFIRRQSPTYTEGVFPSCRFCLHLYRTTEEQSKTKT